MLLKQILISRKRRITSIPFRVGKLVTRFINERCHIIKAPLPKCTVQSLLWMSKSFVSSKQGCEAVNISFGSASTEPFIRITAQAPAPNMNIFAAFGCFLSQIVLLNTLTINFFDWSIFCDGLMPTITFYKIFFKSLIKQQGSGAGS